MSALFIKAASLAALRERHVIVVKGADRSVSLFLHDGKVCAVDNRCPHMGFPLDQGTLKDGILTCHWHHARFDLCSGCTFDLFADDVSAFDVKVEGDDIYLAQNPRQQPTRQWHEERLERGLGQAIGLVQAKSVIGLLASGASLGDIARQIALFGCANHETWGDGMTTLAIVANLWPDLREATRNYALSLAARRVADNCSGEPARRERHPLHGAALDPVLLARWFRHWVMVRHRDAAERTLLTAIAGAADSASLNELICPALLDRIYAESGHTFDFTNKAFELLLVIGWRHVGAVFPTLIEQMVSARGEEESSEWRDPIDLIPLLEIVEERLSKLSDRIAGTAQSPAGLAEKVLGDDPAATIDALLGAIECGSSPVELAKSVAHAAAIRLARFPESNDVNDWFGPAHTFTYCNAVCQALRRSAPLGVARALFYGAMSIYVDRFLNIPAARLPGERDDLDALSRNPDELLDAMLTALDQRQNLDSVPSLAVRYIRLGHPIGGLIDGLAFATVREDVDFHKLQVLEAAVQQARLWDGRPEVEHLFAAAARHLAAHCPTRRGESQMTKIALRLHRGEAIYDSE
jgi:nitrite reductase/ring-hydroxylating ferredoxin subunit